ncbi:MAG TPA: hypothetical protein VFZ61_13540 [Polyangiales bacterium]
MGALGLVQALSACGGATSPPAQTAASQEDDALLRDPILDQVMEEENARRQAHRAPPAPRSAKSASSAGTGQPGGRTVGVRGITGSLNAFEVEQAMNTRSAALLACVEQRPRSMGHVAGDIAFHFDVDARGKVERVVITQSDIGYTPLEDCLAGVAATAPFPAPAGAERAEAQWRMSVDPLRQPAEPIDSAELEEAITHQAEATYESCGVGKGRRFLVNGYLNANGKLHPVSVRVPYTRGARAAEDTPEQLACLGDALTQWTRWPKAGGYSKASFELRWVAAPPPPRKQKRTHRRR